MKSRGRPLSKAEVIGLLVALAGLIATVTVPEIRQTLGLESRASEVKIIDGRPSPTPSSLPGTASKHLSHAPRPETFAHKSTSSRVTPTPQLSEVSPPRTPDYAQRATSPPTPTPIRSEER